MNKHKWHDVIVAYAEGRTIQSRFTGDAFPGVVPKWCDIPNLQGITSIHQEWRIKPVKKETWLNIYPSLAYSCHTSSYPSKEEADKNRQFGCIACVHLQYEEGEGL